MVRRKTGRENKKRNAMNIEVISREDLPRYKDLILPYIYEELEDYPDDREFDLICLAGTTENADGIIIPVSALVMQMEPYGDLAVLSIYTLPDHRRRGIASELLDKAVFVSRQLYVFDEGEDEEIVDMKAVYRLSEPRRTVFEEFLKKNHFTDYFLLDENDDPQVWAAIAQIRFYKTGEAGSPE